MSCPRSQSHRRYSPPSWLVKRGRKVRASVGGSAQQEADATMQ